MANNITSELRRFIIVRLLYREWDLNPHSHFWPKDFKSFVSTDSTIAAQLLKNRLQSYNIILNCANFYAKNFHISLFLGSDRYMKAGLSPFVLHVNTPCALVVEQHLSEHQLQVILRHVVVGARNFVVAIVGDVEGCTIAMARLVGGVNVPASLQQSHILLRPKHARYVEPIVRQPVAREDVRPLFAYRLQLRRRFGNEIRNRVGQRIHHIVVAVLH